VRPEFFARPAVNREKQQRAFCRRRPHDGEKKDRQSNLDVSDTCDKSIAEESNFLAGGLAFLDRSR
jgi:hypothetical protein